MISNLRHPDYLSRLLDYEKWRLTYEGGRDFIQKYLKRFSAREDYQDFQDRKSITYCPAFAKAGIEEVKNSIYQRMSDITRVGGSKDFTQAVLGHSNGVDLRGNSMNSFIGQEILTELLVMGKVGCYVDMPKLDGPSLKATVGKRPYLYVYKVEDIQNWVCDKSCSDQFESILLKDTEHIHDDATGFPMGVTNSYRRLWKENGRVHVQKYNYKNEEDGEVTILEIPKIPFVLFEVSNSLLTDIADYQIALMNLASSDIGFTLKANFPFYIEQYDVRAEGSPYLRYEGTTPYDEDGNEIPQGQAEQAEKAQDKEIKVGITAGRRYPLGTEAPTFIHPSAEPMKVSMEKQEQLKREIRLLLNLSLATTRAVGMASAESKRQDDRTLEAGLSNIGLTLEKGEREIADIWANYEGQNTPVTVKYPINYSLRDEESRRQEAQDLEQLMKTIPSSTYQKEVGKQITRTMLGHYVSGETLTKIDNEIEQAPNMVSDPDIIAKDVENGLCSPETGSKLRGYPDGESERAADAHTERLARIAKAQGRQDNNFAARGVPDLDDNIHSGKVEKSESRETVKDDVVKDKTRGEQDEPKQ